MPFNRCILILVMFCTATSFAQSKDEIAVNALLDSANQHFYDYNKNNKAFDYLQKALKIAGKHGLKQQLAESYSLLGSLSYGLGLYYESLIYINNGKKVLPRDDKLTMGKLLITEALILDQTGLEKRAMKQLYKVVNMLLPYADKKEENIYLRNTYEHISAIYGKQQLYDSVAIYHQKIETLLFSLPEEEMYNTIASFYYKEAMLVYNRDKNLDSALLLFQKSFAIEAKYSDSLVYLQYYNLGNLYREIDHDKSLEYYLKCIENAAVFNVNLLKILDVYKSVAELYKEKGDHQNEKKYLLVYTQKYDEANEQQKKSTAYILNTILAQNEQEQKQSRYRLVITVGIALALMALLFLGFRIRNQQQRKQLSKRLEEKQETVQVLEKRINEAFDEILDLAKNNDPHFWDRFQEIYPHFRDRLLQITPDLKATELTLCAYIYLGFSSKEIAEYTFKAEKTLRNNRYNLRKRLNIATDEDIIVWMKRNAGTR